MPATLIQCPTCGADCSSAAPACPKCGHPFHQSGFNAKGGAKLNPAHTGRVTTTEKTGKGLKLQLSIAAIGSLVGLTMLLLAQFGPKTSGSAPTVAATVLGIFVVWLVIVKLKIWWRHG